MKKELTVEEIDKFRSAMLYEFAVMDAKSDWVQQFHYGATRNNNVRMFKQLGPDTGYDAIGDAEVAAPLARFLSRLDEEGVLAKSIFYNLNPRDNELLMTTIYSFNDGTVPGKMQYGSAGVPGSDSRHGKADERIVRLRVAEPLRRNAHGFTQFPILSAS